MHHAAGLKALLREEGRGREDTVVPKPVRGERRLELAACSGRERALIAFALKLTKTPSAVCPEDVGALKENVGLTDREVHDLVNCVAYFAYVNRVVAGQCV